VRVTVCNWLRLLLGAIAVPDPDTHNEPASDAHMTESVPFAPLADRPPFEEELEDFDGQTEADLAPSPRVADLLGQVSDAGLDPDEMLELAIFLCGEVAADLSDGLSIDGADPESAGFAVEAITRLQVAAEVLASVDLGGDDDLEDEEGLEEDDLAA